MRSPGWKFATSAIGSDLPFRETFISTRGPVRSNAAASPHAILATLRHANATAQLATVNLEKYLRNLGRCKNTSTSLSGLGVGIRHFRKSTARMIIPRHKFQPTASLGDFL